MRHRAHRLCRNDLPPRPRVSGCFRPDQPPKLPDPGIYSQRQRFSQGAEVSFQNPDIGMSVSLSPSEGDNEVTARRLTVAATNFSDDAPAAGVMVMVEGARWGIAMPRSPVGAFQVDLGPASTENARAARTIELEPTTDFGTFFVRVNHPKDRDPSNNEGIEAQRRQNVPNGPFSFPFTVHNPLQTAVSLTLHLSTDDWDASVSPQSLDLLPGQLGNASMSGVADVSGMEPSDRVVFTILALAQGEFFGGLTYRLGPSADD